MVCSAFAGGPLAAWVGPGNSILGTGLELDAIAAATIGGVSHSGILVFGGVNNGMLLPEISPYLQNIVKGVIIIGAMDLDMRKHARKA